MASSKKIGSPFKIPANPKPKGDALFTTVLAAPQEMSVKNIYFDTKCGHKQFDLTPTQYMKLVTQGLLPKSDQHDFIAQIALAPGADQDAKIVYICGCGKNTQ